MEELEFIPQLKGREPAAFVALIAQYRSKVINTCFRFLLNKEDAEDISQEVFVEIFHGLPTFRGDSKLSTWIYRIAVGQCLDEIKKRNRKKRIRYVGKMLGLDEVAHWLSGGEKADAKMETNEKMDEILVALNALPDNQRVAFTLSKIEGYSNPEIADIMDTTTVAVESLIYRAKTKVSQELEKILKK